MNERQFWNAALAALGSSAYANNEKEFWIAFSEALAAVGGSTYDSVSNLSGDWKGTGTETLAAALTDLENRLAGIE